VADTGFGKAGLDIFLADEQAVSRTVGLAWKLRRREESGSGFSSMVGGKPMPPGS